MDRRQNSDKKRKPRTSGEVPPEKKKRGDTQDTITPSDSQNTKITGSSSSQNTVQSNNGSNSSVDKKDTKNSQESVHSSNEPPSQDTSTKVHKDENSQRTNSTENPEPIPPDNSQDTEPSPNPSQSVENVPCTKITGNEKTPEDQPKEENGKRIKFSDQSGSNDNRDNSTHGNDPQTSAAADNPKRRRRCIYGSKCYRQSSEHRLQFSHPGDDDYQVKDDRPDCKYGSRCTRKNPQHWKDYRHPKNDRKRPSTPVRSQRSNDDFSDNSSADESVDESEYDPSGLDESTDDEEEEYESDW